MDKNTLSDLHKACLEFRNAIIKSSKENLSIGFQSFPLGSCGDASLVLGFYLESKGLGVFDYVCGKRNGYTHAWLEKDGIILDITGSQFEDCNIDVYVGEKNLFYMSFEESFRHTYFDSLKGKSMISDVLYKDYRIICKLI